MTTKEDVIACARTWLGVPFRHQGRSREYGVDCIGLVICMAKDLQLIEPDFDVNGYQRTPNGNMLMDRCNEYMTPVPRDLMVAGHLVVISFSADPQHFGIVVPYRHGGLAAIHASSKSGKVEETRLMFTKALRFQGAFNLPGVV